jgi:hypothetical protein
MVGWFDLASSAASPCLFGTFALDPLGRLDAVDVHCTVQSTQSLSIVGVASLPLLRAPPSVSASLPITAYLSVWYCDLGMEGKKGAGTSAQTLAFNRTEQTFTAIGLT